MKMIKHIASNGFALLCAFLCFGGVKAQETQANRLTPASIELIKAKALWFHSSNTAGLALDQMENFNTVSAKYDIKNGDYKRPQEGGREGNIGFNTEGSLKIGKTMLWGDFTYDNEKMNWTQFNTMLLDPYRGVPYYVSDPVISDWKRQTYALAAKAASPFFWDRLSIGIAASYTTQTGAKQVDPRSNSRFYEISAAPGMVFKWTPYHYIGAHMIYKNMNEQTSPTNSNNQLNQNVFILSGLGNYVDGIVGGLSGVSSYVYNSNLIGGGLQYSYWSGVHLLLSGEYQYRVEDVTTDPTKPKKVGSTRQNIIRAQAQLASTGTNLHKVVLAYNYDNMDGIQYVQELDSDFNVQKWIVIDKNVRSNFTLSRANFSYDFFKGREEDYGWRAGVTACYYQTDQIYYIPESTLNAENLNFGANVKANFRLGAHQHLLAGVNGGYNANLDGEYIYGGSAPTSVVITQFMRPDFEYLISDYYHMGAELTYSQLVSKNSKTGFFLKAAAQYFKPTEGDDYRLLSSFVFGLTF